MKCHRCVGYSKCPVKRDQSGGIVSRICLEVSMYIFRWRSVLNIHHFLCISIDEQIQIGPDRQPETLVAYSDTRREQVVKYEDGITKKNV
jgi:hypothetical protein